MARGVENSREALLRRLSSAGELRLSAAEARLSVELLETASPPLQRTIGDAWIRSGEAILPVVVEALAHPVPTVRRVASFVLGELLARSASPEGTAALALALGDSEPKVRKNAAIALGKAGDPAAAEALLRQLEAEPMDYVRPSLILALGALGGDLARQGLARQRPATEGDARALRLALERSGERSLAPVALDHPVDATLDLLCRPGLEPLLAREVYQGGLRPRTQGPGFVRLRWQDPLRPLLRLRLFEAIAFPLLDAPANPLESPELAAQAFARSPALALLETLSAQPRPAELRYRVTLDLPPRAGVRRRDWIAAFERQLAALAPGLANSAGQYSWELLLRAGRRGWYLGVLPAAIQDERFAYRVTDVPAALNPTIGAAMAYLAPATPGDVVLDPFCGSGTPLVERARRAPTQRLIGVDSDDEALSAARQNLSAAGLEQQALLLAGDARQLERLLAHHGVQQVDAVLTNPPYGVRVGAPEQIGALYDAALAQIARVLRPGGSLAMLAKDAGAAQGAARRHGLALQQELRVDSGGMQVAMLLFQREGY